jgi:hypothetical protein
MKPMGVILLLTLLVALACGLALSSVGNHALDKWAEQSQRPPSATDTIMRSRQTSGVSNRSRTAWFGAGLLALVILAAGVTLFIMRGGSELLRQWRLVRQRPSRRQPTRYRSPRHTPYLTQWPELPQAPSVRYLPEVTDEEIVDTLD